jgi:hypothetical protein
VVTSKPTTRPLPLLPNKNKKEIMIAPAIICDYHVQLEMMRNMFFLKKEKKRLSCSTVQSTIHTFTVSSLHHIWNIVLRQISATEISVLVYVEDYEKIRKNDVTLRAKRTCASSKTTYP